MIVRSHFIAFREASIGRQRGIGLGMADALARAGCAISIWGRNPEKKTRASARLRAHGGAVDTRLCDVSDRKAVEASFAATLAEFGRIDACFANAGIGGGGRKSFVDRSEEEWRRMFAVNLDRWRVFGFLSPRHRAGEPWRVYERSEGVSRFPQERRASSSHS